MSVRDEFASEAGGRFVQLSRGRTHFDILEPPPGEAAEGLPPVVLLHGVCESRVVAAWGSCTIVRTTLPAERVLRVDAPTFTPSLPN